MDTCIKYSQKIILCTSVLFVINGVCLSMDLWHWLGLIYCLVNYIWLAACGLVICIHSTYHYYSIMTSSDSRHRISDIHDMTYCIIIELYLELYKPIMSTFIFNTNNMSHIRYRGGHVQDFQEGSLFGYNTTQFDDTLWGFSNTKFNFWLCLEICSLGHNIFSRFPFSRSMKKWNDFFSYLQWLDGTRYYGERMWE